ncbi:MAG: C39 family peptidase [Verrucomicrobiales bacterium]|nr:C39 family peptidase [Verrucomicrobiae bacterium]
MKSRWSGGLIFLWACFWGGWLHALPFPTEFLAEPGFWDTEDFKEKFEGPATHIPIVWKSWPGEPVIWEVPPHHVSARFVGGRIDTITVLFLDSGTHFGYLSRDQAEAVRLVNQDKFRALFLDELQKVRSGLEKFSGQKGESFTLGKSRMLRQEAWLFVCGNSFARLQVADEQLIKVSFHRDAESARDWRDATVRSMVARERGSWRRGKVRKLENGDHVIEDVPLLLQGDRAYCGVSTLAMVLQTLGVNMDTEELAAGAGIHYGSTQGSKIREIMDDAGLEGALKITRATKFDSQKVRSSVDAGIPVLVWRRFSEERNYLHTQFARRYREDSTLSLPSPDSQDRSTWPGKESFTHASVITGYNPERREIIFMESWGEFARGRRMRLEEMDATCYYQFTPQW